MLQYNHFYMQAGASDIMSGMNSSKNAVLAALQKEILSLQGMAKTPGAPAVDMGLGPIENAFPGHSFPMAAVHEFVSYSSEDAAATNGFISGVLSRFMQNGGACLWVSTSRTIYPPALKLFGIEPDRVIFIDLMWNREALWVIEEALKCASLAAVVGECRDLDFTQSRRLQLAVEKSKVPGFIHRCYPKTENTVACATRWKIKPVMSRAEDGLPGVGFPCWEVALTKVRNGYPGVWTLYWKQGQFYIARPDAAPVAVPGVLPKTGSYG
jgi:protein ImuA